MLNLLKPITSAAEAYVKNVKEWISPTSDHCYHMIHGEGGEFLEMMTEYE
jgi:hypothetical protein